MANTVIRVRVGKSKALQAAHSLPRILAGRGEGGNTELEKLYKRVGMVALSYIKQAFIEKAAGGTDEAGMSWAPLKSRQGEILRDTGILLNSFSPGDPGNILDPGGGIIKVGSNVPYAGYQHEGTETIPARPLWPPADRWPSRWRLGLLKEIERGLERLVEDLLRGGG